VNNYIEEDEYKNNIYNFTGLLKRFLLLFLFLFINILNLTFMFYFNENFFYEFILSESMDTRFFYFIYMFACVEFIIFFNKNNNWLRGTISWRDMFIISFFSTLLTMVFPRNVVEYYMPPPIVVYTTDFNVKFDLNKFTKFTKFIGSSYKYNSIYPKDKYSLVTSPFDFLIDFGAVQVRTNKNGTYTERYLCSKNNNCLKVKMNF
jgi:hypothetical protein